MSGLATEISYPLDDEGLRRWRDVAAQRGLVSLEAVGHKTYDFEDGAVDVHLATARVNGLALWEIVNDGPIGFTELPHSRDGEIERALEFAYVDSARDRVSVGDLPEGFKMGLYIDGYAGNQPRLAS